MSPRDGIGRHTGLKIQSRMACQFESGRGYQMANEARPSNSAKFALKEKSSGIINAVKPVNDFKIKTQVGNYRAPSLERLNLFGDADTMVIAYSFPLSQKSNLCRGRLVSNWCAARSHTNRCSKTCYDPSYMRSPEHDITLNCSPNFIRGYDYVC